MNEIYLKGTVKLLEWTWIIVIALILFTMGLFTGWLIWG